MDLGNDNCSYLVINQGNINVHGFFISSISYDEYYKCLGIDENVAYISAISKARVTKNS